MRVGVGSLSVWHGPVSLLMPSAGACPAPEPPASGLAGRLPREEGGLEGRYGIGPLSLPFHGWVRRPAYAAQAAWVDLVRHVAAEGVLEVLWLAVCAVRRA